MTMPSTERPHPHGIAVALFGEGKSAAEIRSALVSSGMAEASAEALVKGLGAAASLLGEGKSAADAWSALVSSGVEPGAAEVLVKDLLALRGAQIAKRRE